jgi:hypothetical protein
MIVEIARFELLRVVRQPANALLATATIALAVLDGGSHPVFTAVLATQVGVLLWMSFMSPESSSSDVQYVLSRGASRRQWLFGRWTAFAVWGVALCTAIAIALAIFGVLGAHSRFELLCQEVRRLEDGTHASFFGSEGQRVACRDDWHRRVIVEVPWATAGTLALAFLGFVVGFVQPIWADATIRWRRPLTSVVWLLGWLTAMVILARQFGNGVDFVDVYVYPARYLMLGALLVAGNAWRALRLSRRVDVR